MAKLNSNEISANPNLPLKSMLLVDLTGELGFWNMGIGRALNCELTLGLSFSWLAELRTVERTSVASLKGTWRVGNFGGHDLRSNSLLVDFSSISDPNRSKNLKVCGLVGSCTSLYNVSI